MSSPLDHISKGPLPHPPVDNLDHGPVEGIVSKPVDVGPLPGESENVEEAPANENSHPAHDAADRDATAEPVDELHVLTEPADETHVQTDPAAGSKSEDVGLSTDGPAILIDDKPTGETVEVVDSAIAA